MAILFWLVFVLRKLNLPSFTRKLVPELNISEKTMLAAICSYTSVKFQHGFTTSGYYFNRNEDGPAKFVFFKALNRYSKFNRCSYSLVESFLSSFIIAMMRVFSKFRRHLFPLNIFATRPKQSSRVFAIYFYNQCFCYASGKRGHCEFRVCFRTNLHQQLIKQSFCLIQNKNRIMVHQ